jgi:NTE family protein
MGAVVAATYALREDWYDALLAADIGTFPNGSKLHAPDRVRPAGLRRALEYAQTAWSMVSGWGAPEEVAAASRAALEELLGLRHLDGGRVPVVVCATDLRSGARIVLGEGSAVAAVYASSALAGVLPPANDGDRVLADGAYADVAPVDVARSLGPEVVIAVDPGQVSGAGPITNGLQAVMRAVEICHHTHAHLRLREADLVLRPRFRRFIDVLEFSGSRECVAAGAHAVRAQANAIEALLRLG